MNTISLNTAYLNGPVRAQSSPPAEPEPRDTVERGTSYGAAREVLGWASGVALTFNRMIVGGCAGGGQGLVKGTGVADPEQAELGFKLALGANLAATGALAGGFGYDALALTPAEGALAGAMTNAIVGNSEWKSSSADFQKQVRGTADRWVESSLAELPPALSQGQGMAAKVARGLVGEVVGLGAGLFAAGTIAPQTYREGREWGTSSFDKVAAWMEKP